jgi:hypothetical protein
MITLLTILTLGLYWIYLNCKIYCTQKGWCRPTNISFRRGKLVITSQDRVLCWSADHAQQNAQRNPCLAICLNAIFGPAPAKYLSLTTTQSFLLRDVAELVCDTHLDPSSCCGIGSCASAFNGSITISWNTFTTTAGPLEVKSQSELHALNPSFMRPMK